MDAMRAWSQYYASYETRAVWVFGLVLAVYVSTGAIVIARQRLELQRVRTKTTQYLSRTPGDGRQS